MLGNAVEALFDVLFEGTGRRLLGILGIRPSSLVATFAGLGFWAAWAIILFWLVR